MTTKTSPTSGTSTPRRRRVVSDAVAATQAAISVLAFNWRQTTWSQRAGWQALGRLIGQYRGKPALTAYQAYVSVNSVTFAQSGTDGIVQDAPESVLTPPPLHSGLAVSATMTAATPSVLSIRLVGPAHPAPVEVYALGPVTSTHDPEQGTHWTKIGDYGGIPLGGLDITEDYEAAFDGAGVGAKIFVKVQPVNPHGFKGYQVQRSSVVLQLLGGEAETGPDTADGGAEIAALHVG